MYFKEIADIVNREMENYPDSRTIPDDLVAFCKVLADYKKDTTAFTAFRLLYPDKFHLIFSEEEAKDNGLYFIYLLDGLRVEKSLTKYIQDTFTSSLHFAGMRKRISFTKMMEHYKFPFDKISMYTTAEREHLYSLNINTVLAHKTTHTFALWGQRVKTDYLKDNATTIDVFILLNTLKFLKNIDSYNFEDFVNLKNAFTKCGCLYDNTSFTLTGYKGKELVEMDSVRCSLISLCECFEIHYRISPSVADITRISIEKKDIEVIYNKLCNDFIIRETCQK